MNLSQWFVRNMGWKITSVLIATVLVAVIRWDLIEQSSQDAQGRGPLVTRLYSEVPIIVLRHAAETNRVVLTPSVVQAKVKGNSAILSQMDPEAIRVTLDLLDASNTNSFRAPLAIELPKFVTLVSLEPRDVAVVLARAAE